MTRFDVRFVLRHPLRWARHWWVHLAVACLLFTIAGAWTSDVYEPVRAGMGWPIAVGSVATFVLASALAPLETKLVATVGATMTTLGVVRALAYIEVAVTSDVSTALLVSLSAKWLIIAALGMVWPVWTAEAATAAAVDAGREDRAR